MKLFAALLAALALVARAADDFPIPAGFELQLLEPTGGRIARPAGWFYRERHGRVSYTWILSKEDPDSGPYETGVRIQTLIGVKAGTGKAPKEFIVEFLDQKRSSASVLSECAAADQGLFTRACLETEETIEGKGLPRLYHLQYSVFWGNGSDIAIVVTAGSPIELWPQYKDTFAAMGQFELIDMARFAKRPN